MKKIFEMAVEYDVQAARAEFYAMGIQEGIEKGKLEVAKKLLINGVDINIIELSTGLRRDREFDRKKNLIKNKKNDFRMALFPERDRNSNKRNP